MVLYVFGADFQASWAEGAGGGGFIRTVNFGDIFLV
jgi:hypothetical protein